MLPVQRMSDPPGFHKIRSVEVSKGFLAGVRVEFSEHLSCVIGTRGAGKRRCWSSCATRWRWTRALWSAARP